MSKKSKKIHFKIKKKALKLINMHLMDDFNFKY